MSDEVIRILSHDGLSHRMKLTSTRAMRDRIRELAMPPRDDFDRAVLAVLDDLQGILAEAARW